MRAGHCLSAGYPRPVGHTCACCKLWSALHITSRLLACITLAERMGRVADNLITRSCPSVLNSGYAKLFGSASGPEGGAPPNLVQPSFKHQSAAAAIFRASAAPMVTSLGHSDTEQQPVEVRRPATFRGAPLPA